MEDDPRSKKGGMIVGFYSLLSFFLHFEVGVYLCLSFVQFFCCRKVLMLLS